MKAIFLGTGTSHGVPVLTCSCPVCTSTNPKNHRTRSSLWLQEKETSVLIDTAHEFRLQALRADIQDIDAVLYTHCHADHVFGFDDLRVYSHHRHKEIPVYGNQETIDEMYQVFGYAFRKTQKGGGKPQVKLRVLQNPLQIGDMDITPIPVFHGILPIYAYRIGSLAYVTDTNQIPPESLALLKGVDTLVLGVVRYEPHSTHMHIDMALDLVEKLQPRRTYFTHLSHLLEHEETNARLPAGVELAYDGLEIEIV